MDISRNAIILHAARWKMSSLQEKKKKDVVQYIMLNFITAAV